MIHRAFIPKGRQALSVFLALILLVCGILSGCQASSSGVRETDDITIGIDVAKYQGTIDWEAVAEDGVEFAMVRVGYRAMSDGLIVEDSNARYNLQEAQKFGIKLGAYFFSTAVTEEEAVEEANWVADILSQYSITYPVVYDCEGFTEPDSRQYGLSKLERTDIAFAFMETIEERGYEAMFYASKNELQYNAQWETSRIEKKYKIWVAQYPQVPYPETESSSYDDKHHMWQYAMDGKVAGITQNVDLNVAYFGYDGIREPLNPEPPEEVGPDVEALMDFVEVNESVTAKIETNLRSEPSQDGDHLVKYTLQNGEIATRIAISDSGWSKLVFNGEIYYALTNYLTTDMHYVDIKTPFTEVNEQVTAKDVVNLRNIPSTTHEDAIVVAQLKNGEVITRTGINTDVGWSRVVYNGQVLYCVSSYLNVVE